MIRLSFTGSWIIAFIDEPVKDERITHSLLDLNCKISITIVAGPGFKNPSALERLASFSEEVRVLSNITSLADPLFSHNAILCSGGVTLHEALVVGTPAFVLSQVPHQEKKARAVVAMGAAINLGLAENFDAHKLAEIIVMRGERLQAMSKAGKKVIDGRGIDRVADEILRLAAES